MAAPSSVSSSYSPYVGPRRPFLRDGEDSASPPSPMRQFDFDESPSRRRGADALRQLVRSGPLFVLWRRCCSCFVLAQVDEPIYDRHGNLMTA